MSLMTHGNSLAYKIDSLRVAASHDLNPSRRPQLGQFFTPCRVAALMAAMLNCSVPRVHILDAGAGSGVLFGAAVDALLRRPQKPAAIEVTAYEIDGALVPYLEETMSLCRQACNSRGVAFQGTVCQEDFIESGIRMLRPSLFQSVSKPEFTVAILNPPYLKIRTESRTRELLREIGVETSNLYSAFLSVATRLLAPGGQLVAITPRSFCNGPYFRPFREDLLHQVSIRRLHLFQSRDDAFRDDAVLQETLIMSAVKGQQIDEMVLISTSAGPDDDGHTWREVPREDVIRPGDPHLFIRIVEDDIGQRVVEQMERLHGDLSDLGLAVSTGRVVDFRSTDLLRDTLEPNTAPLIYPAHLEAGKVVWPKVGRKPNALVRSDRAQDLLLPTGNYVLVKRFSAKEERRRVVAAVFEGDVIPGEQVAFENHLNYFHRLRTGFDIILARGLAAYLNSSLVDAYFRQFNGHTQVNATDLRSLRYPTEEQLRRLGEWIGNDTPSQQTLDEFIGRELLKVEQVDDPIQVRQRVEEARHILEALDFPKPQQNERSALTLLALLDLRPSAPWAEAEKPLRGITQMMDFFRENYGKNYAPNTRETVRRQTVHQFLDAGLIVINPDEPERPTNSGKTVYQIERDALGLLRSFGTDQWDENLSAYLRSVETLKERYAQQRQMTRIPVRLPGSVSLTLSPGGQNVLVKQVVEQFAERFLPGATLLYLGDTDDKFAVFDREGLDRLSVSVSDHGKMPDVIIHDPGRNWLVLVEAVTSHGPVNPKRRLELEELFKDSTSGLVFVTAFLTRRVMASYLSDLAWETEVWVAEDPEHLIHFDGERFLGPYC